MMPRGFSGSDLLKYGPGSKVFIENGDIFIVYFRYTPLIVKCLCGKCDYFFEIDEIMN